MAVAPGVGWEWYSRPDMYSDGKTKKPGAMEDAGPTI